MGYELPPAPPTSDPFESWLVLAIGQLTERYNALYKDLLGNLHPGRVQKLEDQVESLNRRFWILAGGGIAIWGIVQFFSAFSHH